jgi:tripartite-type tricarboxylate transporter receptor subunit TctC
MSTDTGARRRTVRTALLGAAGLVLAGCSGAGEEPAEDGGAFPSRPINVVVPYAPGGSADGTTRQLVAAAQETCGAQFVVRNETGGSGAVGFRAVLDAAPDGYTIGTASIELSILEHLGVVDITPDDYQGIMQYSEQPVAFAVPRDSPITSFQDLVDSDQERITVATSGTGSIYHLGYEGMALAAGVDDRTVNVPFDGASSALQAALGGQTDMVSVGAAEMRSFVESGELRALALAGEPVDYMPDDVPTLEEMGYDWTSTAILGLYAPAGVPQERVQQLSDCFDEARQSESFTGYMETTGLNQVHRDTEEFDAFLGEEYERFGEVVEAAGMGVDR